MRLTAGQLRKIVEGTINEVSNAGLVMRVVKQTFLALGYNPEEAEYLTDGPPGEELMELLRNTLADYEPGSAGELPGQRHRALTGSALD